LSPANFTTLPHFSVSSATSLPKSTGVPGSMMPPRSATASRRGIAPHLQRSQQEQNWPTVVRPVRHIPFPFAILSNKVQHSADDRDRGCVLRLTHRSRHRLAPSGISIWRLIGNVSFTSNAFRGVLGRHRQPPCRLAG
jgi:hypothetical protein